MSFFGDVKVKAAGLIESAGRLFSQSPVVPTPAENTLHALDNPDIWRNFPAYDAPSDVDIVKSQKWIDDLMGRTRGESIYKLVWNGDKRYWHEYCIKWDTSGKPTAPAEKWPIIRYGTVRNPLTGMPVRQLFPPRWLILSRLEPEQYADHWRQESYIFDPKIRNFRQIRPDVAPPVYWLWFHTVGHHTPHCCMSKARENKRCFGTYAPPEAAREHLENQRDADLAEGKRAVYEKVDRTFINETEEDINGYRQALAELEADAEYYAENPMALIGLQPNIGAKDAKQLVKDHFDKQIQETAKLIDAR